MPELDEQTRYSLLRYVRGVIESHLTGNEWREVDSPWAAGLPVCGAFVTLRNAERLRGCVGTFEPSSPLLSTLASMAIASLQDPRFRAEPVSARELAHIRIELSLLSQRTRIDDPTSITLGHHGVYIRRGSRTGCFLPDVATEQDWTVEEFLSQCCAHKAGLPPDAWRSPETEVFVFSVLKLSEPK